MPTASLDTERGTVVMGLLRRLGREREAAVIVVTHDEWMVEGFDRVYRMLDGRISPDGYVPFRPPSGAGPAGRAGHRPAR